eukprot:TRINITY_DN348_c0_g1_i1.p1 TRINITY_DN348_c0_g1~~TRINITY_DN348_c0_g1_i1.p1  ORF type:complete len:308 (-),score=29.55 TRINITY_DN348_c0_g1_i1:169-1092(-)
MNPSFLEEVLLLRSNFVNSLNELKINFYSPSQFKWNNNTTPLADPILMLSLCVVYLLAVNGIQRFMMKFSPFSLTYMVVLHNGFLCLVSLILMVLISINIIPKLITHGFTGTICRPDILNGALEFYCYLNYLVKLYELLDTIFLVLKKKDVPFLHLYHHPMTVILTFIQLSGKVTVQWVPILLNLIVHVVMYYYYMMVSLGRSIWWKKYLTSLQIIQFVIDLVVCWYAFMRGYYSNYSECEGDNFSARFGVWLLSSYLLMFVDFFLNTYTQEKKRVPGGGGEHNNHRTEKIDNQQNKKKNNKNNKKD